MASFMGIPVTNLEKQTSGKTNCVKITSNARKLDEILRALRVLADRISLLDGRLALLEQRYIKSEIDKCKEVI